MISAVSAAVIIRLKFHICNKRTCYASSLIFPCYPFFFFQLMTTVTGVKVKLNLERRDRDETETEKGQRESDKG